jgi:hypothetical protein
MTTTTKTDGIRQVLNKGDLNNLGNILSLIKFGNMMTPISATFTISAASSLDITTAAAKAAASLSGITLETGENLPPVGRVVSCRVTAGTATGPRIVSDTGATASAPHAAGVPGIAKLSADCKTITFEANVTVFLLQYYPAPAVALTTAFPMTAP